MRYTFSMNKEELDDILGITRCVRCGHRLEGEVECPFCSIFDEPPKKRGVPKWIFITACFLTSPFSLYAILKTDRLNAREKVLSFSGCLIWVGLYILCSR
jgi:hypothetical protein